MTFIGNRIAYFFKPFAEEAKKIIVACFTADDQTLIMKWGKNATYRELFAAKSKVVYRRVDRFYKIKNLHAKIYLFDDRMFLSSANLTYGSLFVNYEFAVEVTAPGEKKQVLDFLDKLRGEREN